MRVAVVYYYMDCNSTYFSLSKTDDMRFTSTNQKIYYITFSFFLFFIAVYLYFASTRLNDVSIDMSRQRIYISGFVVGVISIIMFVGVAMTRVDDDVVPV